MPVNTYVEMVRKVLETMGVSLWTASGFTDTHDSIFAVSYAWSRHGVVSLAGQLQVVYDMQMGFAS